jgi:aconitate hydratase
VKATKADGSVKEFDVLCRLDTDVEIEYFKHGGILAYVLRNMAK